MRIYKKNPFILENTLKILQQKILKKNLEYINELQYL